jgi:toluene monooxygenase electron transfer component
MTTAAAAGPVGHRIGIDGGDQEYVQQPDDTVLRAALRHGIGFPYECNSGGCGSCRFQVLEGEVEDLWPEAPGRSDRDRRTGRLLACQSRATSDLRVAVRTAGEFVPVTRPTRHTATLVSVEEVTHDIRTFRFGTDAPAEFRPGQYAVLTLPGVPTVRCYSMSNLANEDGSWEFMIRRVPDGRATTVLFDRLAVGDTVGIDGPYGLAWLRTDRPGDVVCIAGGSGLAPMVSIARAMARGGMLATRHLHFFFGARTPRDVCGEQFLRELPSLSGRIHFHPVVSLPELEPETSWAGETGFVHDAASRLLGDDPAAYEWYFAGPPPMTQALQERLVVDLRVPVDQIHFDRFC